MKREKTGFFAEDCQFLSLFCEKKKKKQEDLKSLNGSTEFDYLKYIARPETDWVCTTQYIIIIISLTQKLLGILW